MPSGGVAFVHATGTPYAHVIGHVGTANRRGLIKMRLDLASPPPEGTTGVRLIMRVNAQRHFVQIYTWGTLLPWQDYQAGFDVTKN